MDITAHNPIAAETKEKRNIISRLLKRGINKRRRALVRPASDGGHAPADKPRSRPVWGWGLVFLCPLRVI